MKAKTLSYEEFVELAKENYTRGGDVIVECWEKYQFETYVDLFGPVTKAKALKMFREYHDQEQEERAINEQILAGEW